MIDLARPTVKQGIIKSVDTFAWTATVQLLHSPGNYIATLQLSKALAASSISVGDYCAVLFFDDLNPADAVIVAVYSIPSAAPGSGGGVKAPVKVTGGSSTGFTPTVPPSNFTSLSFTIANAQTVHIRFAMDFKYGSAGNGIHVFLADGSTNIGWTAGGGNAAFRVQTTSESELKEISADVDLAAGTHTINLNMNAAGAIATATIYWFQLAVWFSST